MTTDFTTTYRLPSAAEVRRPRAPRVWAGAVLLLAALLLILLGGCFLVGVLAILTAPMGAPPPNPAMSSEVRFLMGVLYVLAFACLTAAVVLGVLGVRGLWRVLSDAPAEE